MEYSTYRIVHLYVVIIKMTQSFRMRYNHFIPYSDIIVWEISEICHSILYGPIQGDISILTFYNYAWMLLVPTY